MVQVELNALTANRDPTGSLAFGVTIRNCLRRLPNRLDHRVGKCDDDIDFQTNQFGSKDWELFRLALGKP